MALERKRIIFDGRVQGVGFRVTAARLAPEFGVTGFVRNLPEGQVELEAQGEPDRIGAFVEAIRGELGPRIRRADETPLPLDPGDDFSIRYWP